MWTRPKGLALNKTGKALCKANANKDPKYANIGQAKADAREALRLAKGAGEARVASESHIEDTESLFSTLRRSKYEFLPPDQPLTDEDLVERLNPHPQALVVVNLKRQAQSLYRKLVDQGRHALHLSTRNCPAHRTEILARARGRLKQGEEVVLVSTQCIEAGVDVDFPRLFRAYAPLDSIVQAAGRCNREGLMGSGLVTVYEPEDGTLPGQPLLAEVAQQTGAPQAR